MPYNPFTASPSAAAGQTQYTQPIYNSASQQAYYSQPTAAAPATYNHSHNQTYQTVWHHASPASTAHSSSPHASPCPASYTPASTPGPTLYSYSNPSTPAYSPFSPVESPAPEPRISSNERKRHAPIRSSLLQSLNSPQDPHARPEYTYKKLCEYALKDSANGMLTLNEIYHAVEARFPSLQRSEHKSAWRSGARHDISRDKQFKQIPRPIVEPGRGDYWYFDENESPKGRRSKTTDNTLRQDATSTPTPVVVSSSRRAAHPIGSAISRRGSVVSLGEYQLQSRSSTIVPAHPVATGPLWQANNPYLPMPRGQTVSSRRQSNPYLPDAQYTQPMGSDYTGSVRYQPYARRSSQSEHHNWSPAQ